MKQINLPENAQVLDGIVSPDMVEAVAEAEQMVVNAHIQAAKIVREARSRAETVAAEIAAEGEARAAERLSQVEAEIAEEKSALLAEAASNIDRMLCGVYASMPILIENILYRIIGAFDEQELTARCIAMGFEEMRDAVAVTAKVNPAEVEILQRMLKPWLRDGVNGFVRLEEDSFIPLGHCTLVSDIGTMTLSVREQIAVFVSALEEAFAPPTTAPVVTEGDESDGD